MHQSTAACHCLTLRWGPFRLMFRLMALRLRQSIGTLTALQSASLAFPDDFRMNQLCPKTVIFGIFQWLFQWLITNHDESHCAAETALVLVLRNVLPSQLSHLSRRHRATGPMLAAPRTCFEPSKGWRLLVLLLLQVSHFNHLFSLTIVMTILFCQVRLKAVGWLKIRIPEDPQILKLSSWQLCSPVVCRTWTKNRLDHATCPLGPSPSYHQLSKQATWEPSANQIWSTDKTVTPT